MLREARSMENREQLILTIDEEYLYIREATAAILEKLNDKDTLKSIITALISVSYSDTVENYIFNNYCNLLTDSELNEIIKDNKEFI